MQTSLTLEDALLESLRSLRTSLESTLVGAGPDVYSPAPEIAEFENSLARCSGCGESCQGGCRGDCGNSCSHSFL